MNNNEMVIYALVAIAALTIGYVFATNAGTLFGGAGNSTAALSGANSTPAKSVQLAPEKVAKLKDTLEAYIAAQFGQKTTLTFQGAEDNGEFVMVNFTDDQGRPIPIPVSRDMQYMYGSAIKLDDFAAQIALLKAQQAAANSTPASQPAANLSKSDKPKMEVFVMSYCPYGLQMEKAVEPVKALLADKADIEIKFVSYTMHGAKETQENARQYCIMQNDSAKYWDYLSCFTASGDATACMANQSIDNATISACMASTYTKYGITDSGTAFPIYAAENTQYGVQGSPTVVINGAQASVSRSPEAVKTAICSAFTTAPAECATTLSTDQVSPGFGAGAASGTPAASCGS